MLVLYPSNKLEHLSYLLGTLLSQQPLPPFTPQTILVESPGMQHWLNMQLATQQGIAMNLHFPLPTRFLWETARHLLGADKVPKQSAYRREVLVWRIERILREDEFLQHPLSAQVCRYWSGLDSADARDAQRLQFATALADVYEQYLMYRPQWLFAWEHNQQVLESRQDEGWQALIWRMLVAQQPLHPARLHKMAIEALQQGAVKQLPERVVVFAINTLAPQMVQFFDALAAHTDIHLFHLNPSVNYWGDMKSDREQARFLRSQGVSQFADEQQRNPFLANLGKQGRELFNQLTELQTYEISAFDVAALEDVGDSHHRLAALQADILHARSPNMNGHFPPNDPSITLVRAHSGLREVQGLHDALLEMMQKDPGLHPSDILVMCPAIEEYAPLVDAVFHRVGAPQQESSDPPRIPCSIADRSPMDSEPLIAAFISLLSLPDSRFEVSKILDYLRLEALQNKFALTTDDLQLMTEWLQNAHVHWGLDGEHKARISDGAALSSTHSWSWGLKRLLLGMALEDRPTLGEDYLSVPDVEGQNSLVLGKLAHLVEQLGRYAETLKTPRTAIEWHHFLVALRDSCFAPTPEVSDSWESIARATSDLAAHCEEAGFSDPLSLRQVRDILLKRFSSPDAGNHFMTGQVTFCSMLPMRSIPFKVVCILGLNDGEFPRQSQPISIDLMAGTPRKTGDRSRRLEDRYLFLEALISARQHLYLSYQANSAQDNSPRQPSLVLAELMQVLEQGYAGDQSIVRQLGLHPFSARCFESSHPSFETGWYRLAQSINADRSPQNPDFQPLTEVTLPEEISVGQLSRALRNPLEYFANHTLGVFLQDSSTSLQDAEPFTEDPLTRYQVLDALAQHAALHQQDTDILRQFELSGQLPDSPLTGEKLALWSEAAEALAASTGIHDAESSQIYWLGKATQLSATAWLAGDNLKQMHCGKQSASRMLSQYLSMLCFNAQGHEKGLEAYYLKWSKQQYELRVARYHPLSADQASALLASYESAFAELSRTPLPCFVDAGLRLVKDAQSQPLPEWQDSDAAAALWRSLWEGQRGQNNGLNQDPYVRWFYPQGLSLDALPLDTLHSLFSPLLLAHKDVKI